MSLFSLAIRNFWRHRARYQVLLTLVALGAALSLVLLAATASFSQTLHSKAAQYFGGDVSVMGYSDGGAHRIADESLVLETLRDSGLPIARLFRRTISYNSETILFHKDRSLKQRRMIGVDPISEKDSLADFDWDEGGPTGIINGEGIVVSRGTADKLRVEVGDVVTLLLDTVTGSKNTLDLRVSGIFHDTSFFGYSSYLSIETLNRALGLPKGTSTDMGLSLADGFPLDKATTPCTSAFPCGSTSFPCSSRRQNLTPFRNRLKGSVFDTQ